MVTTNKVQAADKILSTKNVTYYAEIIRNNDSIASLPYGVEGYKVLGSSKDYMNKTVTITQEMKTDRAGGITWAYMTYGTMKGWIDVSALKIESILTSKNVDYTAKIKSGHSIDTVPWGTYDYKTIGKSADYTNEIFQVKREASTVRANWALIYLNGKEFGWIDVKGVTMIQDTIKPQIEITGNPTKKTNANANLIVTGKDNESGVKSITTPDGLVIAQNTVSYLVTKNGNYTFTVTDKNGNKTSQTISVTNIDKNYMPIEDMKLSAAQNKSTDAIDLIWNPLLDKSQPYNYQMFSKKPNSSEFQTISATDLNKKVKVLNVYPNVSAQITYTTWDGTKRTISKAASLEMWMEEPNTKNAKGYGMGLIDVTPVDLVDFNENPTNYLKNSDGTFKYDVVYFGGWDNNGFYSSTDLSQNEKADISGFATQSTKAFIESGRGVLFGHDTIIGWGSHPNFVSLRNYANIKTNAEDNTKAEKIASTEVVLTAKGLFTSYPWNIGEIGDVLTVPYSHSNNEVALGDVWMKYNNFTDSKYNDHSNWMGPEVGDANGKGTSNYYLTTWNNVGMIQTGHSNGVATEDEQKILANTLFYLAQLTTDTKLSDRSAMDVIGPTFANQSPSFSGQSTALTIDFADALDEGSTFEYYVEATGENTGEKIRSKNVTATNNSGLAGYSYVLDDKTTTVPDNKVDVTTSKLTYNQATNTSNYLHIVAVDKVGNSSKPIHIALDTAAPTISVTGNPTAWTNANVTLTVRGSDAISGVKEIILPDGSKIVKNAGKGEEVSANYTVSSNGTYTFKLVDVFGNVSTASVTVNRIDKTIPGGTITGNPSAWTNSNATLTLSATDSGGAGVKSITKPDGTIVNAASTTYVVAANGTYNFIVTDNAGNKFTVSASVTKIDKTLPDGTINGNPTAWTSGNASLKLTATDTGGSGYYRTKLPDGTFSTSATPAYTATANGTFNFVVYDNAGNQKTVSVVVNKIDKSLPSGTISGNPTAWTNQNATLTINATDTGGAGVKSIKKPDNTTVTTTSTTFVVSANGTYDFLVTDNAGNEKTVSVVVNKIDKILPDGSATGNPTDWTNGSTTINFTATDSGGAGIKSVQKPDGTTVTTASTTYVVSANGTYNFIVTDNAGNTKTVGVVITNIDKVLPNGTITGNPTTWTNQNVTLTINATDLESGVKSIKKPDGTIVTGSSTSYTVTTNGSYSFVITDNAGNIKTITETVTKIDKELPNGTITGNPTAWTNANVTLTINATDTGGAGVKSIKKPDNSLVTGSSTTFIATENGTFDFVVTDNAGNTKTVSVSVNRIDKTVPGGTFTGNPTVWTNQNATLTINATDTGGSGVKSIKKPDNTVVTTASTTFVVSGNGTFNFVVTDNAGNTKTESIIVSKIDKSIPTLNLNQNPTDWTNGNVTVSAAGADTGGSGVKSIQLPNGNVVNTSTASQVVTENGTYSFSITDNAGNSVTQSIKVSNIDKIVPLISRYEILNVTQDSFDVYVYGVSDSESGINRVVFPTWTNAGGQDDLQKDWTTHENTRGTNLGNGTWKYTVQRSQHNYEFGEYSVHVYSYDNAGNAKAINILYVLKDQVKPTISVTGNPTAWTKDDVTLTVSASDVHTGVKSITLPDGTVVMKNGGKGETVSHSYVVTKSGNYTFSATDMYDNTITQTVIVNKIDKTIPSGTITPNIAKDWTNTDVLLTVKATDTDSGVKSITLPDGTITNGATAIFSASKNNDYSFVITDNVGNKTTIKQTVGNIDKGVPTEGSVQIEK